MNTALAKETPAAVKGLKGVIAADSRDLSGGWPRGLIYRGYNIHELAETATSKKSVTCCLLGELPDMRQLKRFQCQPVWPSTAGSPPKASPF